jgi:hypothetical protein
LTSKREGALVFGMVDGSTLVLGLFLGEIIAHQSSSALWHAALGGGLAELGGMGLGQYWSDPDKDKWTAFLNGAGCCMATIFAGLPFAVASRSLATILSAIIIALIAVLICVLRAETGTIAILRTFGLLIVAGLLSGASGFI